jgi:putative heme-binding domain-containing protein
MEGMREGLEGRFDLAPPPNWAPVYERLKRSEPPVARLAQEVAQQFGDSEAARRNLAAVRNTTAPLELRRRALQALTAQRWQPLVREIPSVLDDRTLRVDAIRAVAAFDDESLGKVLIARYPGFSSAERVEAIQALASRPRYGRMLTEALAKDVVPKSDVPVHVARQLRRVVGTKFVEVWGPVDQRTTDEKAYSRYRGLLSDSALGAASITRGRALFQQSCGPCHKMYGEGGSLGPDLTGSNRANLDYLLFNILEPNGEVQDAYKMVVITTRDGRMHTGNVAAENDRRIMLRVVGRDDAVVLNKSSIQSREATSLSMMPPGLFTTLTDGEIIDLVGYLRTVEPARRP